MANRKELNRKTEAAKAAKMPQPEVQEPEQLKAKPKNLNHTSNPDDLFNFILMGFKENTPPNGNRNNWVFNVANECNRFAMHENEAYNNLLKYQEKDFTSNEIKTTVLSAYKNVNEFGTKEYKPKVNRQKYTATSTVDIDENEMPFIRCGCDYFKVSYLPDRFIEKKRTLIPWKRAEIVLDHGQTFLQKIPKYDSFTMIPDNKKYQATVNNCYNLYSEFPHQPAAGSCDTSLKMVKHIFGDQYEQGIKYLQCLYQNPRQALPILALVSSTRETGKSTFLNWLQAIFGDNMAVIQSSDLESSFNGVYANKNIIAIDETLIERSAAAERLKNISTAKRLTINNKYVAPYSVDFFGKIILCSNKENSLIRIDDEEVRYWIRKVEKPKKDIPKIEESLINEIPAFLNFLDQQPPLEIKSRMMFLPDEISTEQLKIIKTDSMSTVAKELNIKMTNFFENDGCLLEKCFCAPIDIKEKFFKFEGNIGASYIGTVLRNEFHLTPAENPIRYTPFNEAVSKTGRAFEFIRSKFTDSQENENVTDCNF